MLNIAEGSGSDTKTEFLRYLCIAKKSLYETIALLKFIDVEYPKIYIKSTCEQINETGKLLNGLIKKFKTDNG